MNKQPIKMIVIKPSKEEYKAFQNFTEIENTCSFICDKCGPPAWGNRIECPIHPTSKGKRIWIKKK